MYVGGRSAGNTLEGMCAILGSFGRRKRRKRKMRRDMRMRMMVCVHGTVCGQFTAGWFECAGVSCRSGQSHSPMKLLYACDSKVLTDTAHTPLDR